MALGLDSCPAWPPWVMGTQGASAPGSPTPLQICQGSHPDQVLASPGPLSPAHGPYLGVTACPQPGVSQGSESICRVPTAHPALVPSDSTWENRSLSSGVPAQGRADLPLWLARC